MMSNILHIVTYYPSSVTAFINFTLSIDNHISAICDNFVHHSVQLWTRVLLTRSMH